MLTYGQAKTDIKNYLWAEWQDRLANGYDRKNQTTGDVEHVDAVVFKEAGFGSVYIPELKFERIIETELVDNGKHFGYFQMRTAVRENNTIRGGDAECGVRYTTKGIIMMGLYLAKSAYTDSQDTFLTELVMSIFNRPKTNESQVWFRNPRPSESIASASFNLNMVFVNFQFDELI